MFTVVLNCIIGPNVPEVKENISQPFPIFARMYTLIKWVICPSSCICSNVSGRLLDFPYRVLWVMAQFDCDGSGEGKDRSPSRVSMIRHFVSARGERLAGFYVGRDCSFVVIDAKKTTMGMQRNTLTSRNVRGRHAADARNWYRWKCSTSRCYNIGG